MESFEAAVMSSDVFDKNYNKHEFVETNCEL